MLQPLVSSVRIKKISDGVPFGEEDLLAMEEPLEIRLGYGPSMTREQKCISVTMRTPGHDFELAVGFLFSEGILKKTDDILQIKYCDDGGRMENKGNIVRVELKENVDFDSSLLQRNFYITSGCGICGKASIEAIRTIGPWKSETIDTAPIEGVTISKDFIISMPDLLRKKQSVFEYTGGLHACALFNQAGNMVQLREDVGRHNALDKLIGASLESFPSTGNQVFSLERFILLLSGRVSFELIQKAAMANLKIVCAVGAPSSLAVEMAKEFDITLIGFLRGNRFNIYHGEYRVIF